MAVTSKQSEIGNILPPTKPHKESPKKEIKIKEEKMENKITRAEIISIITLLLMAAGFIFTYVSSQTQHATEYGALKQAVVDVGTKVDENKTDINNHLTAIDNEIKQVSNNVSKIDGELHPINK